MAAIVAAATLFGAAMLLRKRNTDADDDGANATPVVALSPSPAANAYPNAGAADDRYAHVKNANQLTPIPVMPNRNGDDFVFRDESLDSRLRWMQSTDVKPKSEQPIVGQLFSPAIGAVDNVHVRSKDISNTRAAYMERPVMQRNTLPFEQIKVGPGVAVQAESRTGSQGFHYGMARMMPNDVHVHHREQRGGVGSGKSGINQPSSTPYIRRNRPETFFEVSEDYVTAAPGRSTATGSTMRTEPMSRHTNRATVALESGPAVAVGITGTQNRSAFEQHQDASQRGQYTYNMGAPSRDMGAGYVVAERQMSVADNQRSTIEMADKSLLAVRNPGQPVFSHTSENMRPTMREGTAANPVTNVAPSAPEAAPRGMFQPLRTTDRELTQLNEYTGPAQSHLTNSSEQMQVDALNAGRFSKPTAKELTHQSYVGNARTSVDKPTTYADILAAEGYTNKPDPVADRTSNPQRVSIPLEKDFSLTQLTEEMPNASRGNNLQRSSKTNLYIRNEILDVNPNKMLPEAERLDPATLTDNTLYPKIVGGALKKV